MTEALPLVHLALVAAYGGLQWTVRVLVYPQFATVPADAFPEVHVRHSRLISRLVGPLFAGQAVTTGWLLIAPPSGTTWPPVALTAGALAGVLLLTALGAVPLHRQLGRGFSADVHRRLLRVDTARTAAATGNVLAAGWLVLG
ncbi:DUF1772 domain-containing protein [Modestobacter roseus]|uniref:DUF1772 domain-containing protein n=1 Tax=Modestobacter roseus TaxID=1181884 RepID=A0A562IN50_9ACTN|nr:DUF1772 domain-containing protein [Modestobacter roseus]MQA35010.1 DUF1772 domain-containing protein [Modestobacter roseus]TWH72441.1 hypothetical protein JD78_00953 [Modestobacter roseus]